jgi:nucleolar MIF4G domain-containing protein 1
MHETLMAIKNNNMTKIPQFDPSLVEHFRKLLKGMITNGKYVTTLNITMDDLLNGKYIGRTHFEFYKI